MNHIEALGRILENNIGNRLTAELANGIVMVFNQATATPAQTSGEKTCDNPSHAAEVNT